MNSTQARESLECLIKAMGIWEGGLPERIKAAKRDQREEEEGGKVMSEYNGILTRSCTERLRKDPESRRVHLHFRRPSPYDFIVIDTCEEAPSACIFHCHDQRTREYGERFRYHMEWMDGKWLLDKREYVPGDGTPTFMMSV